MPTETTIVVCDQHEICCRALRLLLDEEPDFRVLGVTRPADATETARRLRPDVVVVAADPCCGDAFLLRSDPVGVFTEAIRQVRADSAVLSPRMTRKMLDRVAAPPSAQAGLHVLTSRELEMLRCLARGLTNREIAGEIGIAVATVKAHVSRLLTKLGLRDRAAAVVFAYEVGLVGRGRSRSLTARSRPD